MEVIDKKDHMILASSRVNIEDYAFRAQNGSILFWKEEQGKIKKHRLALILWDRANLSARQSSSKEEQ